MQSSRAGKAVVVLGDIGNEVCIAVLEGIAETDEVDWVRKGAQESIDKIRLREENRAIK